MTTQEFFVFHETLSSTTNTKVFFKPHLDQRTFVDVIRPEILKIAQLRERNQQDYVPLDIQTIDGYPHYIVVRWLRTEVILRNAFQEDQEADIVEAVDTVLNNAFGWEASVIHEVSSYREVQDKALELKVNWSSGQLRYEGV